MRLSLVRPAGTDRPTFDEGTFEEWTRTLPQPIRWGLPTSGPTASGWWPSKPARAARRGDYRHGHDPCPPRTFGVTDSFIMGSMGSVVGEKLTRSPNGRPSSSCR